MVCWSILLYDIQLLPFSHFEIEQFLTCRNWGKYIMLLWLWLLWLLTLDFTYAGFNFNWKWQREGNKTILILMFFFHKEDWKWSWMQEFISTYWKYPSCHLKASCTQRWGFGSNWIIGVILGYSTDWFVVVLGVHDELNEEGTPVLSVVAIIHL